MLRFAPLAFVVLVFSWPQSASALLIDDFSNGAATVTDPLGSGRASDLQTGLDATRTVGGARHVEFNAIDPFPFGDIGQVTVQVDTTAGVLRHNPDPGLAAANLFVSYGDTSLGLPVISLDLLSDGADRLVFDFLSTIPNLEGRFALDVILQSENGTQFYKHAPVPSSPAPSKVAISFGEILSAQPTFDLTQVSLISFGTSNGTMNGFFELSRVATVPEPGAVLMVFVLLALLPNRTSRYRPIP